MVQRTAEPTGSADVPVRLRRPPACDPPYDDERIPGMALPAMSTQPFLYLPPATPGGPPLRVTGRPSEPGEAEAGDGTHATPASGASGAPAGGAGDASGAGDGTADTNAATSAAVGRFLRTCLEIFNGRRPVAHLASLTSPAQTDARRALTDTTRTMQQIVRATGSGTVVRLRRTRACRPRPGVAEIAAVLSLEHPTRAVRYGPRDGQRPAYAGSVRALACRLEHQNGRWLCTVARLL